MNSNPISSKNLFAGFGHAFNGLVLLVKERNIRYHFISAIATIGLGYFIELRMREWIAIAFAIGLVFMAEIFNSAIEHLCNHVTPAYSENIKKIKDISAAAVLFAAITAFIIGMLIFIPKIYQMI